MEPCVDVGEADLDVGSLSVLSVGRGHLEISFNKAKPDEVAKAKKIISDMLRRGYTIVVEEPDGSVSKVKRFSPKQEVYFVEDPPPGVPPKKSKATRPVPMRRAKATSIGRTAGG